MYRKFRGKKVQLEPSLAVSNLQIVLNAKILLFFSLTLFGLLLHLQNAANILHSSIEIVFVFSLEDVEMSGCTFCQVNEKIQCKFLHK